MVHLEKINGNNVWDIIKLSVNESQRAFVAGNDISIIEAYIAITGNGHAFPFGIYDDEAPVGFIMIGYGTDDHWEDPPAIAGNNYNIWRLMIDEKYQYRGYGKAALALAIDFIRTFPCGKADKCWVSYAQENKTAEKLYRSFSFEPCGEKNDDEIIAVLNL